jgi:DAK2 domain fusion protein YloV
LVTEGSLIPIFRKGTERCIGLSILYISTRRFKAIINAAADWVLQNRDLLNKINVFPVPDGDTGSNMSMTLSAAVREMEAVKEVSLETVVKAAAWGALMGARGNSGIIMAQILSAFSDDIEGRQRLSAPDIVSALSRGAKKAYKAVLHPAEGTILTVVRETSEAIEQDTDAKEDLALLMDAMVSSARCSVERTPLLLPKLQEAGVVDAGGLGFLFFLEGMQRLIHGMATANGTPHDEVEFNGNAPEVPEDHVSFRYCTEFMVKGAQISEETIKNSLANMGDSIVVVGDSRAARIHIHTGQPEEVLRHASRFGHVSSIKVNDMLIQHTRRLAADSSSKSTSVIAIALGDGFKELFYNTGAELVVDGGPTQNPSTSDIIVAIETANSDAVIILPNNKNVYPAAIQAAERTPKKVAVLRTITVPEGISALLSYMDEATYQENVDRMEEAVKNVRSGEVTEASRDVTLGEIEVKNGDSIGIFDGKIRCSHANAEDAVVDLVETMVDEPHEIVTLYYGESVSREEAGAVQTRLQERLGGKGIELYYGGQPYARYIVSVE